MWKLAAKDLLLTMEMEQGLNVYENVDLPVNAGNLDFILLTHAHIDHSGLIPLLYAKGSEERSMRQEQQPIYVRSCCKTVHTFRNLKRSGRTGKQGDLENQKLYQSIRWMMRSMSCSISCHAHMADRLKLLTALRSIYRYRTSVRIFQH